MKRSELLKQWSEIVRFNAIDVINFHELEDRPDIADKFYARILSIFDTLSKLKHNKFYRDKELETIYLLVKDLMYDINDLLILVNEPGLPALIYEVIFNIFEELFLFCEDYELYEAAQNLLTFRDIWFGNFNVKIIKYSREQK